MRPSGDEDAFGEIVEMLEMGCLPSRAALDKMLWYVDAGEQAINPDRVPERRYSRLTYLDDERQTAALELYMDLDAIQEALGAQSMRGGAISRAYNFEKVLGPITANKLRQVPPVVWLRFTHDLWAVWELQVESHLRRLAQV